MGVGGYRGDGDSRTCCRHGGPRLDARGDLLWSLTMISLIDTLRTEHSPLINAGLAIVMGSWVGAGSLHGVRGRGGRRGGGPDAC